MSKLAQLNITQGKLALRMLYFVAAMALLMLCAPMQEGRFQYEFQRGRVWMYDDLVAQFDFPLYKTDLELLNERNQLLAGFASIFRLDPLPASDAELNFRIDFERAWAAATAPNDAAQPISRATRRRLDEVHDGYLRVGLQAIANVYRCGVLDKTSDIELSSRSSITVLQGDVAYEYDFSNVYTRRNAAKHIGDVIRQEASAISEELMPIWNALDVNRYVSTNLLYDGYLTQRHKSDLLAKMSLTKGMVQAGERIISHGEMVTSEVYQTIESMRREHEQQHLGERSIGLTMLGNALVLLALLATLFLFLLSERPRFIESNRRLLFVLMLVTAFGALGILLQRHSQLSLFAVPFVIVPIFINTFFDSRLAQFVHLITIFIVGFFVPNSLEFIILNFVAGMVAIFTLSNYYHRGRLFVTASMVYLAYAALYLGFITIQEGTPLAANPYMFLWFLVNALLLLASFQLVYVLEKLFGFLSDATLVELSDTNMELLRKLAETAPGTFQHSLQVANLSQSAAYSVGANPLLVRVGALYHDIGKMSNPLFYTENQPSGINPHDELTPDESVRIIIDHVTEGVSVARRAGLPEAIVQFVQSHHGTLTARYFWHKYQQLHPEATEADQLRFTYPGPPPATKEQAIVMMADSIEAASRSLKDINQQAIDALVDTIVGHQLNGGQFLDVDLTFKDVSRIKADFKRKLANIYHARIAYPVMRPATPKNLPSS